MDVVFGKYWLSQCFDAKGEELFVLFSIAMPIVASRGHSQATYIWVQRSFLAKWGVEKPAICYIHKPFLDCLEC